ncbi:hypothetical protein BY458DRAFT_489687 [Sporodiniella umbellata]|nr:hypothetical protein BY458DRAFT_489687 [Sporodiniella umbellata]
MGEIDRPASPMDAREDRPLDREETDRRSRSRSRSPVTKRRSLSRSRSPRRNRSSDRRAKRRSNSRSRSREHRKRSSSFNPLRLSYSPRRRSPSPRNRRRTSRRDDKEFHGTREEPEVSNILGVFGLSLRTREADLEDVFHEFGTIEKVVVVYDHRTNKSRGFGFVYFKDQKEATRARDALNGTDIDERKIRVDYSVTHRPHTPTPGQYMGERRPDFYDRGRRYRDRRRSRSPSYERRRRYYRSRSRSRSWSR